MNKLNIETLSSKIKKLSKNPYLQFILFGLVLSTLPILASQFSFIKSAYITTIGATLIYAIAALGLNILLGWSGLISLGTAGFMGLASYISAYLTVDMQLPFEVALLAAILVPTIIGVLYVHFIRYSYPSTWTLKLSLDFLAMIVIGGVRSIYGTVLGAFIVFAVPDLFLKQIPYFSQLSYTLNGILIILVIMFYPNGIVMIFRDIKNVFLKLFKKGNGNHVSGK